jgi:hypothetical protein
MSIESLSVRLKPETLSRLETDARERGESKSRLAERLIEEGLRMKQHPGIVFRDGPADRRAALADGPDVWEIISAIRDVDPDDERALEEAIAWTSLNQYQVRTALRYYAAYPAEVDEQIRRNDEVIDRLEVGCRPWEDGPAD